MTLIYFACHTQGGIIVCHMEKPGLRTNIHISDVVSLEVEIVVVEEFSMNFYFFWLFCMYLLVLCVLWFGSL